jgi:hypothetical protein
VRVAYLPSAPQQYLSGPLREVKVVKIRSLRPLVKPRMGANRLILVRSRLQSQAGKALPHNAPAPEDRSRAATIRKGFDREVRTEGVGFAPGLTDRTQIDNAVGQAIELFGRIDQASSSLPPNASIAAISISSGAINHTASY